MPEIVIHAAEGRTPEQKKNLMTAITDAVVEHFGVAPEVVTVTLQEAPRVHKMKGGVLFSELG